jgi:hypothetical protein
MKFNFFQLSIALLIACTLVQPIKASQDENIDKTKSLDICATFLIVLVSLTSILTDKPSDSEVRRKIKFEDMRTGQFYGGGITISNDYSHDLVRQVRVYSYNFDKFGSSGRYMKFKLDLGKPDF